MLTLMTIPLRGNYEAIITETTLTSFGCMTMSLSLSDSADAVTLTVTGPDSVYFAVAFGSCKMKDAWALVVPGNGGAVFEQRLAADKAGTMLDASFTIAQDDTQSMLRTVTLTRPLSAVLSESYFAFSTDTDEVSVMWAYGKSSSFANHGEAQRGCASLSFTKQMETEMSEMEEAVLSAVFSMDSSFISGQSWVSAVMMSLMAVVGCYAAFWYCFGTSEYCSHKLGRVEETYLPI